MNISFETFDAAFLHLENSFQLFLYYKNAEFAEMKKNL